MAKIEYDELVQLLQDGKIGHLRFVLESDSEKCRVQQQMQS